jgi:hypothetical protein
MTMFGRRKAQPQTQNEHEGAPGVTPLGPGPHDADAIDLEDGVERLDLGGLLIAPSAGRELRLQVDEATQQVQSVLVAGQDGAVELKPFAAPRNGDLWAEIWPQIADDMRRRGGRVDQREGPHGVELVGSVPVDLGNGEMREQPSRVVGINGPRWLLRATFLGKPAVQPEDSGDWDEVLQTVVVRRGPQAMPVGDALPLRLPPNANRVS